MNPRLFQQAQLALLDNVGCGLFGSIQPWGKINREFALSEAAKGHAALPIIAQNSICPEIVLRSA